LGVGRLREKVRTFVIVRGDAVSEREALSVVRGVRVEDCEGTKRCVDMKPGAMLVAELPDLLRLAIPSAVVNGSAGSHT
jgi:hypothetical protein